MIDIILASKSPYRKQLLNQLGIPFRCLDSHVNEDELKDRISDPLKLSLELSIAKARAVAVHNPKSLIIGSDQICLFEDKILGKTGSYEGSLNDLKMLQGKTHQLITSYAILFEDTVHTESVITTLEMKKLSDSQIKNYLIADNPIDCAGSYKLELKGISLFRKIDTEDQTAIIGLPLLKLANDLGKLGVTIPPES